MIDAPENMEYRLGPFSQALAVVLWPAFISAVVATAAFFSQVDPHVLHWPPARNGPSAASWATPWVSSCSGG